MAGTREGGLKAAETNRKLYGKKFYEDIGRKGGRMSRYSHFSKGDVNEYGKRVNAVNAGRKGGMVSKRTKRVAE